VVRLTISLSAAACFATSFLLSLLLYYLLNRLKYCDNPMEWLVLVQTSGQAPWDLDMALKLPGLWTTAGAVLFAISILMLIWSFPAPASPGPIASYDSLAPHITLIAIVITGVGSVVFTLGVWTKYCLRQPLTSRLIRNAGVLYPSSV